MTPSYAERRQIENEMIFRRSNEKAGNALNALDAMHKEDGNYDLIKDETLKLQFKCECSDENCSTRIPMLLTEYQKIHSDRDTFIVVPNHQADPIETVIKETPTYNVVKKKVTIAEPSGTLNSTTVDNSE